MDLIDSLQQISSRIPKQIEVLKTEEATKNALIMPFVNALGYDVFDPTVVVPEYVADVGTKKGEKVDYVIMIDDKPTILIECKSVSTSLNSVNPSQLYRYFSVTDARFAILTNGIQYRFFSDLENPNRMDEKPFLEIDMLQLDEGVVAELKKFSKANFDLDNILSNANELKYMKEIIKQLNQEFDSPSEDFVKLISGRIYTGRFTASALEQFTSIVLAASKKFIKDRVNERIQSALDNSSTETVPTPQETDKLSSSQEEETSEDSKIVTTEEEIEGYHIVKAILSKIVPPERVIMRDTQSYCGILLDDNNRKPICRLRFNYSQKYLGLFDQQKNEEKLPLERVSDIYQFSERLIQTIGFYETT